MGQATKKISTDSQKGSAGGLNSETLAAVCKAMGHPARVRIVSYLKAMDRCVCGQIVDILPLAQSTVSQHLKQLREAGLVVGEVDGPYTCYCLDHDMWERFKQSVAAL